MKKLSLARKRALLEQQGMACCLTQYGLCLLQGVPMTLCPRDDAFATFEHLIPLMRGGTHAPENVRLSHKRCNHERDTRRLADIEPKPAPYIPTDPDKLMPFTTAWLKWKGYIDEC